MKGVLTGTVTFLLTDIEGSARLWEERPQEMSVALDRHDRLVAETAAAHGGALHKSRGEGDSAFCVFPRAGDAVAAAAALQRALLADEGPVQLRVRMALHSGVAELRDGDYFGSVVNRCARLRAIAHGGQVLLSSVSAELARDELPDDASLRELGLIRLKDLARPERVFQLVHPDLSDGFPPPRGFDQHRHNIPVQTSVIIGREAELARARELVARSDARLVTFTGAGGIGKTRLALQVAADAADAFPGGVWFTALASIEDPDLVVGAIARALDMREEGTAEDLLGRIKNRLAEEPTLLLLDNFEHVMGAASVVGELLAATPGLMVLVTSRESLRLRGEHEFPVPPLSCPARGVETRLESLPTYDAVQMFIDRALAVRPGFRVTNDNAAAVAQICTRLDGVPLALELAAARIKLFSPQALLERLEGSFDILGGTARDLPERHQTLRAAIGWSYELLDEAERALLRRLAVFAGGSTLDAAEAVCADGGAVLIGMASLLDKSLLRQEEQDDDEPRFLMLATIREFAAEKLAASGELDAMRAKHLAWCLDVTDRAGPKLDGPDQKRWLDTLERDLDNFRAALRWAQTDDADHERACALAIGLHHFWRTRGYITEGRQWLVRSFLDERIPQEQRMRAALLAADLAREGGDLAGARSATAAALELARATGDRAAEAEALNSHAMDLSGEIRLEDALVAHREAAEIMRDIGDGAGLGLSMLYVGQVLMQLNRGDDARAPLEEALGLLRAVDDAINTPFVLRELSYIAGSADETRALLDEALSMRVRMGDLARIPGSLSDIGLRALSSGDHDAATRYLEEAVEGHRRINNRSGIRWTLGKLAEFAFYRGEYDTAAETLEEAASAGRSVGERKDAWFFNLLGDIELSRGRYDEAKRSFEKQLEIVRELDDREFQAWALRNLGDVSFRQRDLYAARARYEDARRLVQNPEREFLQLIRLGHIEKESGDLDAARAHYERCVQIAQEIRDDGHLVVATTELAALEALAENHARARELSEEAVRLGEQAGPRVHALALRAAAVAALTEGRLDEADRFLTEGLMLVAAIPERPRHVKFLDRFAELRVAQGRATDAVRVLGATSALRDHMGAAIPPITQPRIDAATRVARARLTKQAFEAAWEAGRALTADQVITELIGSDTTTEDSVDEGENDFRLEGEVWVLTFGGEVARVRDAKGLHYLRHMLRDPGREFHVLELTSLLEGGAARGSAERELQVSDEGIEVLDERARAAYRRRITELDEEIREASEWSDDERAARAREELDRLTEELTKATGLGGRAVKTGSSAERARSTVTKAIKSAVQRIAKSHPALGRHLTSTIKTGIFCSYTPDPRVALRWRT